MAKLTLSVDENLVAAGKRYAARQGVSLSRLVARFLESLARAGEDDEPPPILRRLRGSLSGVAPGEFRRHLEKKYR